VNRAVLGVDASIASTGLVLLSPAAQLFRRVPTKKRGDDLADKLTRMRKSVVSIVESFSPWLGAVEIELVVIEMPAFGKNTGYTHMLAGHWWLTVHALSKFAPVAQVGTGTLKKFATGDGSAEKVAVHQAALVAFPGQIPEGFKQGNDVADASVLAAMGAVHLGIEVGGGFAPSGRASVQAVRWPETKRREQ
jgi:crossover junction endodeoxyribonuclease RuvC